MLQESEFIKNLPQHLQRDYLKQCLFFCRKRKGQKWRPEVGKWYCHLQSNQNSNKFEQNWVRKTLHWNKVIVIVDTFCLSSSINTVSARMLLVFDLHVMHNLYVWFPFTRIISFPTFHNRNKLLPLAHSHTLTFTHSLIHPHLPHFIM